MDWVREWVLQIAGIIVLGALCDMMMADGEIKKYVKMVVGLIMVFAFVRPIAGISFDELKFEIPRDGHTEAVELQKKLDTAERQEVLKLYRRKLGEKISAEVRSSFGLDSDVTVTVAEAEERNFGDIRGVEIKLEKAGENADIGKIKTVISEKFGVDSDYINIRIN